jgi:hypothetical protein
MQDVPHAVLVQAYAPQAFGTSSHAPAPVHLPTWVSTPLVHDVVPHGFVALGN